MLHSLTPGPMAWSSISSAILLLLVILIPLPANACCAEEHGPIADCSFSHDQDNFPCSIAELGYWIDTCPDEGIESIESIPAPVLEESFMVTPYFTSCSPTHEFMFNKPLNHSSCHTPCSHGNGAAYAGLNITFKADPWTSEDLRAVTISLRYSTSVRVHCVMFKFGADGLKNEAATEHEFYYDGFIGLLPGGQYTVSVLTLPTNTDWSNSLSKQITIPYETCWVPDLKFHNTPFAVHLTLFEDLLHSFKRFAVHLYTDPYNSRYVNFQTADLHEMDGKNGTDIIFDCIEPTVTALKLYIEPTDCPFCSWYETEVHVRALPPTFSHCPEHDIIHQVEVTKPMADMISVNWSLPTPIFQSRCGAGHNSSHDHAHSAFPVGTTTHIRYCAWQYTSMAECAFNVQVRAVDTIPPKISCPDNITANGKPKMKSLDVTWRTPTFYDASDTILSIITPDMPDNQTSYSFPVGLNTTVKYKITDDYDNVAYCIFSVNVIGDVDPPQITYCPRNINVTGQPNMKSAQVNWDSPQFDDASDTIMTIITPDMPDNQTFYQFPVGVNTTITYRITDAFNNSAYCIFYVYIKETPAATPLMIALSCSAGLLLILVLAICGIWRNPDCKKKKILGEALPKLTMIKLNSPDYGIPLKEVINYPGSQFSIDNQEHPTVGLGLGLHVGRTTSKTNIQQHSSGYGGSFIPSYNHPHPPNVEDEPLVWVKDLEGVKEESSSYGSRYSDYSDDSLMSQESQC